MEVGMKPTTDGVENKEAKGIEEFKDFISREEEYNGKNITFNISSFHEYINCVEVLQENTCSGRPLIFRGHSDMEYQLRPTLMRNELSVEDQIICEKELIKEFKNRARRFVERRHSWEWYALAQHHALPTRFLDWTYRAGTALFFAIENDTDENATNTCAGVWAISAPKEVDRKHDKPWSVKGVQLYNPPQLTLV
jgi:hypothetical protein